jgi:hypothetical protein
VDDLKQTRIATLLDFPLSSPKEERDGVRRLAVSSSNPLSLALSPLGRGEGIRGVSKAA